MRFFTPRKPFIYAGSEKCRGQYFAPLGQYFAPLGTKFRTFGDKISHLTTLRKTVPLKADCYPVFAFGVAGYAPAGLVMV